MRSLLLVIIALLFANYKSFGQEDLKKYKIACIAFYNIENLFDTINDPNFNDEEFTPEGSYVWTGEKYWQKISHTSDVISKVGDEYTSGGPVIVGIAEVENETVLKDIVNSKELKASDYGIVHYDCEYSRGVDVGFLYRKEYFKVTDSKTFKLILPTEPEYRTRDILLVNGELDGEKIHVIVNHWPSRRGGEKRSAPNRDEGGRICRTIVDSLYKAEANAKIFIMGDFNDDPVDASISKHLGATGDIANVSENGLYNPQYDLFKKGIGSLAYRDSWNLFDQIIISKPLLGDDKSTYKFNSAKIFNRKFITQKDGKYAGYPFRTFSGETFQNGYSDHFPSYIFIVRNK
ncbi:MAG: hypothetical protein A2033_01620 [Bacteroidetes bacterium GWA2_31_9]|nr:MAG: hypothetical protein A2033_01620 [Bacteroidetes bacterium GWA2_31_9]